MRESQRWLAAAGAGEEEEEEGRGRRGRGGGERVRVELLDGDHINVDVDRKAKGADLLDKICDELDISERDYFGLLYEHRGDPRTWVDLGRRLSKSFRNEPWEVLFTVKFYPPEPGALRDETRLHLAAAVHRDVMEGRLQCSAVSLALLASYRLQARGDHQPGYCAAGSVPGAALSPALLQDVDRLYRGHRGMGAAEARLRLLQAAARLPQYGAQPHAAPGGLALAAAHGGLSVLRRGVLLHRLPWAMITKLSYKRREFRVQLRAAGCEPRPASVVFRLASSRAARSLWSCSVEQHMFFRRWSASLPRRPSCRRTLQQLRDLH